MNTNNSLKEYYINIQRLHAEAVNILTAINQSLSTSASEVTVNIQNADETYTQLRIPSFLYLESKLEQLDSNFSALFNMPKSGEAWFQQTEGSNMYKLNLVKSTSAPIVPELDARTYASFTENTILKDLVNPKTYIRVNIDNLPDNITEIYMKKVVIYNVNNFSNVASLGVTSYQNFAAAIDTLKKGIDYDEYDSTLKLPIKRDRYNSAFSIEDIPTLEAGNPYEEVSDGTTKMLYSVVLDTITYFDKDDSSITYDLKVGDYLALPNEYAIYKVREIVNTYNSSYDSYSYRVTLEEYIGHITLQNVYDNSDMVLSIYNNSYTDYHYVDVPLEENPYVVVFLSTVQNNVRSQFSEPLFFNLYNIDITDANGNPVYTDSTNSVTMSYMDYYNKYCKNIGDIIASLTNILYPQLDSIEKTTLNALTSDTIQSTVDATIDESTSLNVVRINGHLIDNTTSEQIKQLNSQKSSIQSELTALNNNIDQVYSKMKTTDYDQSGSITKTSLKTKLDSYNTERNEKQANLNSIIEQINTLKGNAGNLNSAKFRIRGITNIDDLENYISSWYDSSIKIIGCDIEYKYVSEGATTNSVTSINSTIYTEWNKQDNIERARKLTFDSDGNYTIEFEDYSSDKDIIRWNQFDIPINSGEDVKVRVRYKYNIGQPFIDIYSPWSNEHTVQFPSELENNQDIVDILEGNDEDTISEKFSKTLLDGGFQEHIDNKIYDGDNTFYHVADNIYSGFSDENSKLLSLKDKLTEISKTLSEYKDKIDGLSSEYKVYIEYDDQKVEITPGTPITINISDNGVVSSNYFTRKEINIIIENTGETSVKFYSLFPGESTKALLQCRLDTYAKAIGNYDRVPISYGNSNDPLESTMAQTLGQWIYFRSTNPYTTTPIFIENSTQDRADYVLYKTTYKENISNINDSFKFVPSYYSLSSYIAKDLLQAKLPYVNRKEEWLNLYWQELTLDSSKTDLVFSTTNEEIYDYDSNLIPKSIFMYDDNENNKYVLKYEHIVARNKHNKLVRLTEDTNVSDFISNNNYTFKNNVSYSINDLCGGFLIPELLTSKDLLCNSNTVDQYKELTEGDTLTIPVIFEYLLSSDVSSISKGLYFDLRPSLFKDVYNYIIIFKAEFTGNNSDASNINTYINSLVDSVTTSE